MYTFFKEIKVSEEESNQSSRAMGHFNLQLTSNVCVSNLD